MKLKRIEECYKKPSDAKKWIYYICVRKALSDDALYWGIISFNCFVFTFGYYKANGDFVRITPSTFCRICKDLI